jgi:hypothetical protein
MTASTIPVDCRSAAAQPAMFGMFVVELTDPGLEDVASGADAHQAAVVDDRQVVDGFVDHEVQ